MAQKIFVVHNSSVDSSLTYPCEYDSIAQARRMIDYYQQKGESQKAEEIEKALTKNERIRELLDKVVNGSITWEEFEKSK